MCRAGMGSETNRPRSGTVRPDYLASALRRWAQYLRIRSLTAFLAAADIPFRFLAPPAPAAPAAFGGRPGVRPRRPAAKGTSLPRRSRSAVARSRSTVNCFVTSLRCCSQSFALRSAVPSNRPRSSANSRAVASALRPDPPAVPPAPSLVTARLFANLFLPRLIVMSFAGAGGGVARNKNRLAGHYPLEEVSCMPNTPGRVSASIHRVGHSIEACRTEAADSQ